MLQFLKTSILFFLRLKNLGSMPDCIFCKIVDGGIPIDEAKIFEDDQLIVFLDQLPVHPGHTLITTKKHYANLEETPEEDLVAIIKMVKKVGKIIKDNLGYEGYNVVVNNDPVALQTVEHSHFHVVPRVANDGFRFLKQKEYKEGEREEYLKKIKEAF